MVMSMKKHGTKKRLLWQDRNENQPSQRHFAPCFLLGKRMGALGANSSCCSTSYTGSFRRVSVSAYETVTTSPQTCLFCVICTNLHQQNEAI